ncbi:MAG: POTRA domain-containing protein, partial [Candidatus Eisenbacteria bacterium]
MKRRAGIALAVLVLALLPGRAFAIDEQLLGALKRVQSVRIEGNSAIKDGAIRKVIKTGAGSFLGLRSLPLYRPDFLQSDALTIQNLYARHGFLSATVAAQADSGNQPNRVIVTYHVHEGPQALVGAVTFDTTDAVPPSAVRGAIRLRTGRPYDPVQVVLDRGAVAGVYADHGHFPTVTTRIGGDSLSVAVHFGIVAGPAYHVRDVAIAGVKEVDTVTVRRELLLGPGDRFQRDRLIKSSERLYDSGLFNSVEIEPLRADTLRGELDITVRVRERKPRWVEAGIGAGSSEHPSLSAEWGNRNLWGLGRAVTADLTYGYNRPQVYRFRGALAYTEPWLLGLRVKGRVVPSFERGFADFGGVTYVQQAWGLSFGLSRDFTFSHSHMSLTLDNTWTQAAERFKGRDRVFPDTALAAPYVRRWTLAYDQ